MENLEGFGKPRTDRQKSSKTAVGCETGSGRKTVISGIHSKLPHVPAAAGTNIAGLQKLTQVFVAKDFQAALDAINAMGVVAEREGHHPDFHLTNYREVKVVLYTHSLNGLTRNDFLLARMLNDEVSIRFSPKWLRANPDAQTRNKT